MKIWIPPVVIFLASIILYLFQVWSYDQIIRAIDPWIPLFGPLLAAALVYYGWNRTNRDATDRDLLSWRRTHLPEIVQELIEVSDERDASVNRLVASYRAGAPRGYDHDLETHYLAKMYVVLQKLEVAAYGSEIYESAQRLVQLHNNSQFTLSSFSERIRQNSNLQFNSFELLEDLDTDTADRMLMVHPTTYERKNELIRALQSFLGYELSRQIILEDAKVVNDLPNPDHT